MKILFAETSTSGVVGGSFFSLLELIRALDRERFRPVVLFYHDHHLVRAFEEAGAEVSVYRPGPRSAGDASRARLRRGHGKELLWRALEAAGLRTSVATVVNMHRLRGFAAQARSLALRRAVGLLHVNDGLTPGLPFIAAAPRPLPIVVHERKIRSYAPIEAFWLRKVDRVICISEAVRRNFSAHFPKYREVTTVQNPVSSSLAGDGASRQVTLARWSLKSDALVLLQLSNLIRWKGQDTAIDALRVVVEREPRAVLLLAGGTPPGEERYESALRARVREHGLDEHVFFCGFQQDPGALLRAADVVVHVPTEPEPFGRVVLEAMQTGKPVVAARQGGPEELIAHGETGLLVAPRNPGALAEGILRLARDADLRSRLGAQARQVAFERFSPRRTAEAVEGIYASLDREGDAR